MKVAVVTEYEITQTQYDFARRLLRLDLNATSYERVEERKVKTERLISNLISVSNATGMALDDILNALNEQKFHKKSEEEDTTDGRVLRKRMTAADRKRRNEKILELHRKGYSNAFIAAQITGISEEWVRRIIKENTQ